MSSCHEGQDSVFHYLPVSDEDEKLGMICTTAGTVITPAHVSYPRNRVDHPAPFRSVATGRILPIFQIVYITQGEGIFNADGTRYKVRPGSVIFVLPGHLHSYSPLPETGWEEYWVGFMGDYFTRMLVEGIISPRHIFFDIGLRNDLLAIYKRILEEVKTQQPLYQLRSCSAILTILAEMLTHQRRGDKPNYYQQIVERAKFLMESRVESSISLPDISDELGISASRFNEIFKTYTAMTPHQYFIQLKIYRAERLLEQEDVSVKKAALSLGFEDQYYFSRLFKNKTGIAPSEWKRRLYPEHRNG
ncbi:MAG: helix-turn-helix domain-containing protein [Spirochaetaceae bacterium]|jgi:AraC-like DNA-binding protein|nr:helix-turn-helix domain-containing protein [Spirochaetaceae bacterium]